jgi:hypothetical protein
MTAPRFAAIVFLLATAARGADAPAATPAPATPAAPAATNAVPRVEAKAGERILSDRPYVITLLPPALAGTTLVQRPLLKAMGDPAGTIALDAPGRVHAAVLWKQGYKTVYSDEAFEKLAADGWSFLEEEMRTTTFEAEYWGWQIMHRDFPAGTFSFPARGAVTVYFLPGSPDAGRKNVSP